MISDEDAPGAGAPKPDSSDGGTAAPEEASDGMAAEKTVPASDPAAEALAAAASETPPAPDPRAAALAAAEAEMQQLAAANADLKNRIVRVMAEMENLRKRTEREKADARKFAVSEFARDVLGIGDNIHRAINHVTKEAAEMDPALQSFLEGVQLLERELLTILERHGVTRIIPDSEPFNPHLHQAVMEEENAEVPAGTVMQVFQAGFMISDRCLRPAIVSVAKGGPKAAKPEAANDTVPLASSAGESEEPPAGEPGTAEGTPDCD